MAPPLERLRAIPLFAGLSDDDLARICTDVVDMALAAGQTLFHEGEPGEAAYVITDGEVEVLKATERREVRLAVRSVGDVIGEMALVEMEPRNATARARTDVTLLRVSKAALDDLLDTSPAAARQMFQTFLVRLRANNDQLRQSERLSQLGTLTAGVAHELNNPASAVARAADHMGARVDRLGEVASVPGDPVGRTSALAVLRRLPLRPAAGAVETADAEEAIEEWLAARGVDEAWQAAGELVEAGIRAEDLEAFAHLPHGAALADAVAMLGAGAALKHLARQVAEGASRISAIVQSLKSYTYLDQAPIQDVDVRRGLDDTLMLLAHRLRGIEVVREYDEDMPTITALGTELNQVWTNLVDNACDALEDAEDGIEPTITLRARAEDGDVVVEIEDNGPGIPEEVRHRVFDAFFTTKPPGRGTGLGLQISHRIVALEHGGDLTVTSTPGRTTFRVVLSPEPPTAPETTTTGSF